jgi:mono/diheme cytochrome c family protein
MGRTLKILAMGVLLAGCASSRETPRQPAAQGDGVMAGRRFAERACAGCHAVGPRGESPNPRSPPFRTLAGRLPGQALEDRLGEIARRGHVEMPPIYMTPQERRDVAAWLRAVAERRAA